MATDASGNPPDRATRDGDLAARGRGPDRREPGSMPYYRCAACGLTSYSAATYSSLTTCPTCQAALAEDAKVDIVPGSTHDVSCTLRARPAAAAEARRACARLALPEITREDLAL